MTREEQFKKDLKTIGVIVLGVGFVEAMIRTKRQQRVIVKLAEEVRLKTMFLNWIGENGFKMEFEEFKREWQQHAAFINFAIDHADEIHT